MHARPLLPLEESFPISPRTLRISPGLPHPLAKFGIAGEFEEGLFADVLLYFIHGATSEEPDSRLHRAATRFLLESEAYFLVCDEAGVDALRLRDHLQENGLGIGAGIGLSRRIQ